MFTPKIFSPGFDEESDLNDVPIFSDSDHLAEFPELDQFPENMSDFSNQFPDRAENETPSKTSTISENSIPENSIPENPILKSQFNNSQFEKSQFGKCHFGFSSFMRHRPVHIDVKEIKSQISDCINKVN